ncbi:MAG TPA: ligase-associated DNA damage response endonuclease PdeM [Piscinibacter sp.]|jgi:DNA ligase-associated metallophosphoesterase|uniref:ligase-associated DNA damage response endonuclease PdeM n=1 Tax=Piscinibacter sp. TaxID=1903157 RepID=UPI001B46536A|nr:ligase-associated DNA damage response endonuclease PdeM [Piscinibacter sp.]MBK7532631.1 ligase-associated DNA damage response endonuclease PdeM [Piscinibacter sp.]MBP6541508.1 ligase-associated DNA damage response endonuclease PdeM [Piscinibacter sp.]HOY33633.1 ligase-associated DNA damage response endonuclease PdeM [Piscinibacter sp.]HPG80990.1 ligase-associated DNA damage response endonuclease PdeM [Piscinibacter sp.]HPM65146.1 ligase-associated DNA damage response endonuclease PdeM [Pisc
MVTIEVAGRALSLLPQKAAFLPDTRTLLIADAHIGKATSFRALGVPVPRGTTSETLSLIGELVARHDARRVVFLGDFLHSARSHVAATLDAVSRWRALHPTLELVLVRGNHDDRAGDPPASLGFTVVDEPLMDGGLAMCHHPEAVAGAYVLAGHLHPCVSVHGRARERLRLPCFHFGAQVGVLPAFGSFTGMHPARVAPGDRVFAVADDAVRELPT